MTSCETCGKTAHHRMLCPFCGYRNCRLCRCGPGGTDHPRACLDIDQCTENRREREED